METKTNQRISKNQSKGNDAFDLQRKRKEEKRR